MSREFKFRVWDSSINEYLQADQDNPYLYCKLGISYNLSDIMFFYARPKNNRWVVQQFTGLKDAKGNPIYEGDILQFSDEDKGDEPCEVIYELGMFGCNIIDTSNNKDFWQLYYIVTKLEPIVIGNVFENPKMRGIYE